MTFSEHIITFTRLIGTTLCCFTYYHTAQYKSAVCWLLKHGPFKLSIKDKQRQVICLACAIHSTFCLFFLLSQGAYNYGWQSHQSVTNSGMHQSTLATCQKLEWALEVPLVFCLHHWKNHISCSTVSCVLCFFIAEAQLMALACKPCMAVKQRSFHAGATDLN